MDDSPAGSVARLDASLARRGSTMLLQRLGPGAASAIVSCRAHQSGYEPAEISGTIQQQDSRIIMSPTQIIAADWPPVQNPAQSGDRRVPIDGDRVRFAGVWKRVMAAEGLYLDDILVRIEMQVRGI